MSPISGTGKSHAIVELAEWVVLQGGDLESNVIISAIPNQLKKHTRKLTSIVLPMHRHTAISFECNCKLTECVHGMGVSLNTTALVEVGGGSWPGGCEGNP